MLIVIDLVIFNVTTLIVYTVLEGVIAEFSPGLEPNRERPKATHGVKLVTAACCAHNVIVLILIITLLVFRIWTLRPSILSIHAPKINTFGLLHWVSSTYMWASTMCVLSSSPSKQAKLR